jgi:hypothetical protein
MSPERLLAYQNTESIPEQRQKIRASTSANQILLDYHQNFQDGILFDVDWEKEFLQNAVRHQGEFVGGGADYFRLVAVANNQTAQFGFESMEGQIRRDMATSSFDPRRELALACFMASLNVAAVPIKQQMSDVFDSRSERASVGIWGKSLEVKRGAVQEPRSYEYGDYEASAEQRFSEPRKILVPNEPLNHSLAEIGFTLQLAETMDDGAFERDYLPVVALALGELLDPQLAFYNVNRGPMRFYSLPSPLQ